MPAVGALVSNIAKKGPGRPPNSANVKPSKAARSTKAKLAHKKSMERNKALFVSMKGCKVVKKDKKHK